MRNIFSNLSRPKKPVQEAKERTPVSLKQQQKGVLIATPCFFK
jgi:hypothetical protein